MHSKKLLFLELDWGTIYQRAETDFDEIIDYIVEEGDKANAKRKPRTKRTRQETVILPDHR
jgi:hypothetical protein